MISKVQKVQIFRLLALVAVLLTSAMAHAADVDGVEASSASLTEDVGVPQVDAELGEASSTAVAIAQLDGAEAVEEVEFSILNEAFLFRFREDQTELDHADVKYAEQMARLDSVMVNSPIQERDVVNIVATTSFNIYMSFLTNMSITSAFNLRAQFLMDYPDVDPAQVKSYYYCNPWMSVAERLEQSADFVEKEDVLDIMRSNDNPYAIEYLLKALYSSSLDAWLFIDQAMTDISRYGMIYIERDSLKTIPMIQVNESATLAERVPEDEDLAAVRESFNYIDEYVAEILENKDFFFESPVVLHASGDMSDGAQMGDSAAGAAQGEEFMPVDLTPEEIKALEFVEQQESYGIPVMALKTNLLYDALTLINAEVEIPMGDRFSLAGEIIFPWWTMDSGTTSSDRNRIQMLAGTLEARYWLGDRSQRHRLTHWFMGVYGGMGKYDLEYNRTGYQSDGRFTSAGLTVGYAHQVAKRLRFEYSVGIGYMHTKYNKYEAMWSDIYQEWRAMRTDAGSMTWIGPTRAKISMSLTINKSKAKIDAQAAAKADAAEAKALAKATQKAEKEAAAFPTMNFDVEQAAVSADVDAVETSAEEVAEEIVADAIEVVEAAEAVETVETVEVAAASMDSDSSRSSDSDSVIAEFVTVDAEEPKVELEVVTEEVSSSESAERNRARERVRERAVESSPSSPTFIIER